MSQRYDLILQITISGVQQYFLFVIFSNSHAMIDINEFQLSEQLGSTPSVQGFANCKQGITIFYCWIIKTVVINA